MDDLSASQEVSGDPLFKRPIFVASSGSAASFAQLLCHHGIAGTALRYASHHGILLDRPGVGLSSNGAGDGPGVLHLQRAPPGLPVRGGSLSDGSGSSWDGRPSIC
eukprot:437042-Hanusia_phi.AAC.1